MGFEFSLLYLTKIFLILWRNQWHIIINAHKWCRVFCVFNETWILCRDLKIIYQNFMKIRPLRAEMFHGVGQIHTHAHLCGHKHTHTHTYIQHTCMSHKQQDMQQVTITQIYTTVTKKHHKPCTNNTTQIPTTYKQFICTLTAVSSLVFACGCYN